MPNRSLVTLSIVPALLIIAAISVIIGLSSRFIIILILSKEKENILNEINKSLPYEIKGGDVGFSYIFGASIHAVEVIPTNKSGLSMKINEARFTIDYIKLIRSLNPASSINAIYISSPVLDIVTDSPKTDFKFSVEDLPQISSVLKGRKLVLEKARVNIYPDEDALRKEKSTVYFDEVNALLSFDEAGYRLNLVVPLPLETKLSCYSVVSTNLRDFSADIYLYDTNKTLLSYEIGGDIFGNTLRGEIKSASVIGAINYNISNNTYNAFFTNRSIDSYFLAKLSAMLSHSSFASRSLKLSSLFESVLQYTLNKEMGGKIGVYSERKPFETPHLDMSAMVEGKNEKGEANISLKGSKLFVNKLFYEKDLGRISLSAVANLNKTNAVEKLTFNASNFPLQGGRYSVGINIAPSRYKAKEHIVFSGITITNIKIGENKIEDLVFYVAYHEKEGVFRFSETAKKNRLSVNGVISFNEKDNRRVYISASDIPPSFVNAFVPSLPYSKYSVKATYILSGGTEQKHIISASMVEDYTATNLISIRASLKEKEIEINEVMLRIAGLIVLASGNIDISSSSKIPLNFTLRSAAGKWELNGGIYSRRYGKRVSLHSKDSDIRLDGTITEDGLEAGLILKRLLLGNLIELDGETDISIKNGVVNALSRNVLSDVNKEISMPLILLYTNDNIIIEKIIYSNKEGSLSGKGLVYMEDDALKLKATLNAHSSQGAMSINFGVNNIAISGKVEINNIPSEYFHSLGGIRGSLQARISLLGTLEEPIINIEKASLLSADFGEERYHISVNRAIVRKTSLKIPLVKIKKIGKDGLLFDDRWNSLAQDITITDVLWTKKTNNFLITFNQFEFGSVINGEASFSSSETGRKILKVKNITLNGNAFDMFETIIDDKDNMLIFNSPQGHGITGIITKDEKPTVSLVYRYNNKDYLFLKGNLANENVSLLLSSRELTGDFLQYGFTLFEKTRMEKDTFPVVGENGEFSVYLNITGRPSDVSIDGRVKTRGKIKLDIADNRADSAYCDISFSDKRINFDRVYLSYGRKDFIEVTGYVTHSKNAIDRLDFTVTSSEDRDTVSADGRFAIAEIKGPVNFQIAFTGTYSHPSIAGVVYLRGADVSIVPSEGDSYTPRKYGFFTGANWDINIIADKKTHIGVPLFGDLYVNAGESLRVLGRFSDRSLRLEGEVYAGQGSVRYLNRQYMVEEVIVSFPSVHSLDPLVKATAKTARMKYSLANGQTSEVILYLEVNDRLSKIISGSYNTAQMPIHFYTVPSLPADDVKYLAGIPVSRSGENEESSLTTQSLVDMGGEMILHNYIIRPAETYLRQKLRLDFFNVETGVFSKVTADLTTDGLLTEDPFSYLRDTRLTFGKYLFPALYMSYNLTFVGGAIADFNADFFNHELGLELNLMPYSDLANFIFEYRMDPLDIRGSYQFNISTKWRF